jgi:hypothetical protein
VSENRRETGGNGIAQLGAQTRFKPGQSGNPAGRPKGVARVFREAVDPAHAAAEILKIAEDDRLRPDVRLKAWSELLDRGYGKAPAFAAIEGADPLEHDAVSEAISGLVAQLRETKAA